MEKLLKIIAVICAISVAVVTGSLYVRGIRDDINEQEQLNQRLKGLCEEARKADWSNQQRSDYLQRHCENHSS